MTAELTQRMRDDYLPGSFGYQPTRQLVEVAATLIGLTMPEAAQPHLLSAILPNSETKVGRFLERMNLSRLLEASGFAITFAGPPQDERGRDDASRANLI